MQSPPDGAPPGARDPRDLDPQDVLERDPHVLLDPRFSGRLHLQLARTFGPQAAAPALLRMGFLHGLAHAAQASAATAEGGGRLVPALAMRYRVRVCEGRTEVRGEWPALAEASSRLAAGAETAAGCCALSAGYTSGWLSGMLDLDLLALEEECSADGHVSCRFVAREPDAWRERDVRADPWLAALPFESDRALVRAREAALRLARASQGAAQALAGIDRSSACVHIWGPVMVLPFGGAEEGLRTLDLLGQDPEAQRVSVVVVDLGDAIIDPAFGALALELIVRTADAWGAETLFAEPSALSEPVLAELDHPPLLVLKGLEQAIATAFQIASVQQRTV
jgi:hypothetical protein